MPQTHTPATASISQRVLTFLRALPSWGTWDVTVRPAWTPVLVWKPRTWRQSEWQFASVCFGAAPLSTMDPLPSAHRHSPPCLQTDRFPAAFVIADHAISLGIKHLLDLASRTHALYFFYQFHWPIFSVSLAVSFFSSWPLELRIPRSSRAQSLDYCPLSIITPLGSSPILRTLMP